ncbi:hypothetical protein [Tessaracoccus sp. OH4464_COT-324]|uniref:hypothetical protein n=1 Tax=Tessaracoccus sp. OH4464_COT-324 TaxID=2491059 RepID=UPI000F6350D2|nr:hypothetical protein [Tessaracoccus sp. OH4464_COT-324]RRD45237.1 hypothetical protein EII42_11420 [Tessaracoccus sp. OH4464_COT-324]
MREGHPVVWLGTVCAVTTVAVGTTNLIGLAWLVACLASAGLLAAGPRRASFTVALGAALLTALWWTIATVALPTGAGPTLLSIPRWEPGPGVHFGGDLTLGAATNGLTRALSATAILLVLGLAGQMVGARSWLALTRLLGPLAPAAAPLACLGEACCEATAASSAARRRGLAARRFAPTRFLTAVAQLSRWQPSSAQNRLPRPRVGDLLHLAAPVALAAVLTLSGPLGLTSTLSSTDLLPTVPWPLIGAATLIPLGVVRRA